MHRVLTGLWVGTALSVAGCGSEDGGAAPPTSSGSAGAAQGGASVSSGGGGAGTTAGGGVGATTCAAPKLTCGVAGCIDPTSNDQHCGACNQACGTDRHCLAGKCECATGQLACDGACVDVQTSAQHCGACDVTCPADGSCKAGLCVAADGCLGLAHDIVISRVVAYQSVAIPLMKDGQELAPPARNADIVADREALLRVFTTPAAGFTARELSARVRITTDGVSKTLFVKGTPKPSTDAELASTFNVVLPRELVKPGSTYSVELAECTDAQGNALAPRFPASGDAMLGARTTGKLKIHFVPVHVGNQAPDVSETRLAYHKQYFEALYPITELEFTLGDVYQLSNAPNFDNLLDDFRDRRIGEQPADDVYYFALSPVPSSDGFADGVGFLAREDEPDYRVAIGTSSKDAEYTSLVVGHEVGHNQGLDHSPGCDAGDPDRNYPYDDALIGVWGYDRRSKTLQPPTKTWDIMAYCEPAWFSDYTYRKVVDRVASVNGAKQHTRGSSASKRSWRVLLLPSHGEPRWGHPYTGRTPSRAAEAATALDAAGNALATVDVYRVHTTDGHATTVVIPSPAPGWFAIQFAGSPPIRFE